MITVRYRMTGRMIYSPLFMEKNYIISFQNLNANWSYRKHDRKRWKKHRLCKMHPTGRRCQQAYTCRSTSRCQQLDCVLLLFSVGHATIYSSCEKLVEKKVWKIVKAIMHRINDDSHINAKSLILCCCEAPNCLHHWTAGIAIYFVPSLGMTIYGDMSRGEIAYLVIRSLQQPFSLCYLLSAVLSAALRTSSNMSACQDLSV